MATPAYVSFMVNSKALKSSSVQDGKDGSSLVISFKHAVFFKELELFTNNPIREHHPIAFCKETDSTSVILYQYMTNGSIMDSVTIDWYKFDEKTQRDEIYLQHILERVKISSIGMVMPNIKDKQFERNVHIEEVTLRYDKITWFCPNGYLRFTDRWNFSLGFHSRKESEMDTILEGSALTDDFADWLEERNAQKAAARKIPNKTTTFVFKAKDGTVLKGVTIKLANGESFVSDKTGTVIIDNYKSPSDKIDIVSIELAA